MSFDKETRDLLARTVAACRRRLVEDVTDQLRGVFGLHPDGVMLPLEKLTHLSPDQHAEARRLRDLLDHYTAGAAGDDSERRKGAYERMALEISFTALNRLAALRLCEERGLVVECVRKGTTSAGFQMFERISGGALGERYDTYRVFLECLFDELALDLGVLFDRMTPQSAVFLSERCMEDVLAELNKTELTHLWTEDETIGWVYQYFNPPEERKAMRKASQAPRNSRELAVRNQFFTPRYVVEFLTDNTLGRIWYEMRKGNTELGEACGYLLRTPNEFFLGPGEKPPADRDDETDLSQEELLARPVYIEHRPRKDPRDLRILDPACGSGHFLLYAFDLLEHIYKEAWADPESPISEVTGRTLQEDLNSLNDLRREIPKLIIEHNLHGIDIDPRAVQIAALALWLRGQKAWKDLGLSGPERPRIARSNIAAAEPMPGEEDMRREFTTGLKPRLLGQIVNEVFEKMKLAGEVGALLRIEEEIKDAVAAAARQWREGPKPEQQSLFPVMDASQPRQQRMHFDVEGITDEGFWEQAEDRILDALKEYAEGAENGHATRRRLFAQDAARGFAFIELCRGRYDVVLMNPPFGEPSSESRPHLYTNFKSAKLDIFAAFVDWAREVGDAVGAITSRTCFFLNGYKEWRRSLTVGPRRLSVLADLGDGVLDAMVEAAAYCLIGGQQSAAGFLCITETKEKASVLQEACTLMTAGRRGENTFIGEFNSFRHIPASPFAYWLSRSESDLFQKLKSLEPDWGKVFRGPEVPDLFRATRCWWEVQPASIGADRRWVWYAKGGEFTRFAHDIHLVVDYHGAIVGSCPFRRPGDEALYFQSGITYSQRTTRPISFRVLPAGCLTSPKGPAILPRDHTHVLTLVGLVNSRIFAALVNSRVGAAGAAARSYDLDILRRTPAPAAAACFCEATTPVVSELLRVCIRDNQRDETSPDFLPGCDRALGSDGLRALHRVLSSDLESAQTVYDTARKEVEELVLEACGVKTVGHQISESEPAFAVLSEQELVLCRLSEHMGAIYGRWDVRMALDSTLAPKLPDPFDPLPVCPPGMLVGPDGLPAEPNRVVSKEWLCARPDAKTLPPEGSVKNPTSPDSEYPLRISWDGILVDDPGFNGDRPHRDDIVRRVREVFDLLWKNKSHEIEQEACDILGVSDLRDYFRKPSGFFQGHLKRYSKSRRKAPIYWPLSTPSGSYTIWLYYHRLSEQTLYGAVNKYVEPKISEVERGIAQIENDLKAASGREATLLTDRLGEARVFLGELRDLREELLRIAALPYKPDLNDGVIINAAPLHKLFRLRSWAKDTEGCWKKLAKGDYDWAHMAYAIWPDRVREVCKKDRSIAIAHGLEGLCGVQSPGRGRQRRMRQSG